MRSLSGAQKNTREPRAPPVEVKADVLAGGMFCPERAFVEDEHGNAKGGVRTAYLDVPTARWVGAKRGDAFQCMFFGYKSGFDASKLDSIYGTPEQYAQKVRASIGQLAKERWLTAEDADAIAREAQRLRWK